MHRPRGCTHRARHCTPCESAEVAECGTLRGRGRNVEELVHERPEEPELVNRLIRVPVAHTVRPVRGEHK